jgi:hypothetical protein
MINEAIERIPAEIVQGYRDLLRMTRSLYGPFQCDDLRHKATV